MKSKHILEAAKLLDFLEQTKAALASLRRSRREAYTFLVGSIDDEDDDAGSNAKSCTITREELIQLLSKRQSTLESQLANLGVTDFQSSLEIG